MLHGDRSTGGVPLPVVRHIAQQLLTALDFLHRECGIVHTGKAHVKQLGVWMHSMCACCWAVAGGYSERCGRLELVA